LRLIEELILLSLLKLIGRGRMILNLNDVDLGIRHLLFEFV